MFNFKAIGNRIKRLRKEQGITQEMLAEAVDVSPEHISRIESGTFRPSFYLIENLATTLHTDEQHILFGTTEPDTDLRLLKDKFDLLTAAQKTAVLQIIDLIGN